MSEGGIELSITADAFLAVFIMCSILAITRYLTQCQKIQLPHYQPLSAFTEVLKIQNKEYFSILWKRKIDRILKKQQRESHQLKSNRLKTTDAFTVKKIQNLEQSFKNGKNTVTLNKKQ